MKSIASVAIISVHLAAGSSGYTASPLALGIANHAFDHLGSIGDQAQTAAASGANIIYLSGLGAIGYQGIPPEPNFERARAATESYIAQAKNSGIRLAIGYVCATSIVKLKDFDRNWPAELRSRFKTTPANWLQVDRAGKPLKSWYGGDYEPACMNNPDWRRYEKFIVRQQLEVGCDGIFFDNPTVHPNGCYCQHCMERFGHFIRTNTPTASLPAHDVPGLRMYAEQHPAVFLQFRCTIARDFLAEMRTYARSVKPRALITANNSLNSANVLFSQCRTYGYNIYEMSKAEDFVVVEDMSSQPRTLPSGQTIEYGPTCKQLTAISHGKPVVAVTIADADYHTAPDLVRLAMAEAVANGVSYLSWPTWPENERSRMVAAIRPQTDFLKRNAGLFADSKARADLLVFLPFRQWLVTDQCAGSKLAAELTKANVQYSVICEDQLESGGILKDFKQTKILLVGSRSHLNQQETAIVERFVKRGTKLIEARQEPAKSALKPDWLEQVRETLSHPSATVDGPPTIRVVVQDQPKRTIVHLLNLNIQKISSFADKVTPADNVHLAIRVTLQRVHSVRAFTADGETAGQNLAFQTEREASGWMVRTALPRVQITALLVIE